MSVAELVFQLVGGVFQGSQIILQGLHGCALRDDGLGKFPPGLAKTLPNRLVGGCAGDDGSGERIHVMVLSFVGRLHAQPLA